jgi:N-acetylgalactosamine-6-phosphate deacetylase
MRLCCCCAQDRVVLITDAMQAAGMPDGRYTLCGEEVTMQNGVVRTGSGGLAGSTLSLDAAVRNMVEYAGVTAEDAIHMASLHPARLLGVDGQLGSLAPGKRANIIALDGVYTSSRSGFRARLSPLALSLCLLLALRPDRKAFLSFP